MKNALKLTAMLGIAVLVIPLSANAQEQKHDQNNKGAPAARSTPAAPFTSRFFCCRRPSAIELAVAEGDKRDRLAHNSFELVQCGAGKPSNA